MVFLIYIPLRLMKAPTILAALNKVLLPIIMLLVFGFQVYTKSFYLHSHKLPDGKIISHSHPYSKSADNSPYKHHSHSKAEYFFHCSFELLFIISFHNIVISYFCWKTNLFSFYLEKFKLVCLILSAGRSPPLQYV